MDSGTLQGLSTVVAFVAFIGVTWWAYSKSNQQAFDEAAQLPFADEPVAPPPEEEPETKGREPS